MQLYLGYQDMVDIGPHYLSPQGTCRATSVPTQVL